VRYAVPVAFVPGHPRELRFQLRVKEIVLILPDSRHY
jgi:hypothetical protein